MTSRPRNRVREDGRRPGHCTGGDNAASATGTILQRHHLFRILTRMLIKVPGGLGLSRASLRVRCCGTKTKLARQVAPQNTNGGTTHPPNHQLATQTHTPMHPHCSTHPGRRQTHTDTEAPAPMLTHAHP